MKNFSGVIGIIILIALIGVGVYYGWQQRSIQENLQNQVVNQNNSLSNQIGNNTIDNDQPPVEYITYTNKTYGFSFDYPKPTPPAQLNISKPGLGSDFLAEIKISVSDNAYMVNPIVLVWSEGDLNKVIAKEKPGWPGFSVSNLSTEGISWTVLKGHFEAVWDADYEIRIGKLPSGYIVELRSGGWSQSSPNQTSGPDQKFLNSFRAI